MPQRYTKEEYARSYDCHAARLYRFALYVLGDEKRAASAVSSAFVEGWQKRLSIEDDREFFENMLRLVWRACEHCVALQGGAYIKGIQSAAKNCDARFVPTLAAMHKQKRAAFVLTALLGDDITTLLRVLPGARAKRPVTTVATLSRNLA